MVAFTGEVRSPTLIASCLSEHLWRKALYSLRNTEAPPTPEAASSHNIARGSESLSQGIISRSRSSSATTRRCWLWQKQRIPRRHRAVRIPLYGIERERRMACTGESQAGVGRVSALREQRA
jgi:hypothetical protein